MTLTKEITVTALPKNVLHKDKTITFEATYRQDRKRLFVNRKLVVARDQEACDPAMWEEVVRVNGILTRDAKAQVLIQ